ncbi:MAG: UDP-N-acetylmuramoyl-L-alanyl-D-glutamate--2,6-diaminopimelate ligase, partial [Clostridia bacterium]|nr:UDP-N-acetylmuramoyl-L-alanyl-D-glutamate--2,6-diaminopimelate ligase [Clostridia bacterium]
YYTVSMYRELAGEKASCSVRNGESDYCAQDIKYRGIDGVEFILRYGSLSEKIVSPMPGEFALSNCLLAAAVLCELGFDMKTVCSAMADVQGVKGRMEQVKTGRDFSVIIDYAHTPDALAKVLNSVRAFRKREQRIVTLFGCGGDRDRSKRSLMGAISSRLSDFVIITSDNCRTENCADIIDEIMLGFDKNCPHIRIDSRREAIIYAVQNAEKGDIVLLCGKGHEEYEIDMNGKHPFSEKEIVAEALKRL